MHSTRRISSVVLALGVLTTVSHGAEPAPAPGNAEHGKALFQQTCILCHATGLPGQPQAGQGPSLAGILGRPSASQGNFGYTKELQAAHLTWDAATLERFLAGPTLLVPGTTMPIPVADPVDRRDLVAFLTTLRPVAANPNESAGFPHAAAAGDWQNDAPGNKHRVNIAGLPAPFASNSVRNNSRTVDKPAGAALSVPAGFTIKLFASGLSGPRLLRTAPNGDIFIAETAAGRIRILRAADGADTPTTNSVFAEGLRGPFGIAFYPVDGEPRWVYVANLNSVVRFPYRNGDLQATGPAETIIPTLAGSTGGHSTRDVVFSLDGKRMFVSVGSGSNVAEGMPAKKPAEVQEWETTHAFGAAWGNETNRANVLVADPDGKNVHVFATGIRNPVGLAIQPGKGVLWTSTNERDALGDDLVPDYVTSVKEGGYYGWPWYYLGNHEDPRLAGTRPDLAGKATVPDVPVQAHSAALGIAFYPPNASGVSAFPAQYRGEVFAAFHGSWNRAGRTGSKVVRIRLQDGVATGEYEDFITGFVIDESRVWGRPVGVTVAHDGALIVSEDTGGTIWRVSTAK